MTLRKTLTLALSALTISALAGTAIAQDRVLNLYSARHYQSDELIFAEFTRTTGIRINQVQADDAGIMARLRAEGAASPADVVLLVDAARLALADSQGMFRPIQSAALNAAIPPNLRAAATPQGVTWYGFSTRARVIAFDPARVRPEQIATYEQLSDPALRGMICSRSGSHPYNLTLFAAMIERHGEARTETWLRGVVANLGRAPVGGDTDQIRAVASGECAIGITNSYYAARLMRSARPEDRAVMERVRLLHPNQATSGTHMNVAGGAVARHTRQPEMAQQFMEFLATPFAQRTFADANNEYPAARGVTIDNPALRALGGETGAFKQDELPLGDVARHLTTAQRLLDRVGFR